MGLLDDAIKEHLELKRRHGADPTEVARLEHEALGPARREPVAAVAPVEEDEPRSAELVVDEDDDRDEVPAGERLDAPFRAPQRAVAEPEPEPEPEPQPDPEPEPVPAAEVEQPTEQFSLAELEKASKEDEEDEEDQEGHEPPVDEPGPHADVVPADDEPENEDVLEETPEFLQETPEHDRLWFEQKPPRDFDF
jgi:hypothetical protein